MNPYPKLPKSGLYLLAIFSVLLLTSCEMLEPTIQVNLVFNTASGIDDDSDVVLNGVNIGEVDIVSPKGNQVDVRLRLNAEKAKGVQRNAAAMIEGSDQARIVIYNPASAAAPISNGETLLGLSSSLELVTWQASGAIAGTVDLVSKAVNTYFNDDEWNRAKKEMNDLLGSLEKQGRETHDQIAKDFEKLIQNLETQSEQALQQAGESIKMLTDKIKELHEQGQEELARTLQQLVDQLQQALRQHQQSNPQKRAI